MEECILFIGFIAMSSINFTQSNKSYIEVTDVVEFKKTIEKYIAKIIVSKELV